jgi:hypothetical protein
VRPAIAYPLPPASTHALLSNAHRVCLPIMLGVALVCFLLVHGLAIRWCLSCRGCIGWTCRPSCVELCLTNCPSSEQSAAWWRALHGDHSNRPVAGEVLNCIGNTSYSPRPRHHSFRQSVGLCTHSNLVVDRIPCCRRWGLCVRTPLAWSW